MNPAISLIATLHECAGLTNRTHAFRDAHRSVARFIHTFPASSANARKDGSSIGRAFLRLQYFHFVRVNVGLDLLPERRTSAPTAETDAFDGNVNLVEDAERNFQAVSDAFEDCADKVRASV